MNQNKLVIALLSLAVVGCGITVVYAETLNINTASTISTTTQVQSTACTDSDGTDYFIKGMVSDTGHPGAFHNYDRCINRTKLMEYTCKNNAWYAIYYECPNGCAEGACIKDAVVNDTETETEEDSETSTTVEETTTTTQTDPLEGTLIKLPNDPKIYLIKNGEKVWIQTAEQFKALGFKWQDVKVVSQEKMQAFKEKVQEEVTLIKNEQDRKVYRLDNGKLIWVPSVAAFNAQGLKWEEVTEVSADVCEQYKETRLIQDEEGNLYYITSSGRKILIVSREVLDSNAERSTEEIALVSDEVANSIEDVALIREKNDDKIYEIEDGKKKWIKSIEEFNSAGHSWDEVETVNEATAASFEEIQPIE